MEILVEIIFGDVKNLFRGMQFFFKRYGDFIVDIDILFGDVEIFVKNMEILFRNLEIFIGYMEISFEDIKMSNAMKKNIWRLLKK